MAKSVLPEEAEGRCTDVVGPQSISPSGEADSQTSSGSAALTAGYLTHWFSRLVGRWCPERESNPQALAGNGV